MADDVIHLIEDALETLVFITEKSGNLRRDLKQDILISVSSLRKELSKLKMQLDWTTNKRNLMKRLRTPRKKRQVETVKQRDKWRHLWTTCSSTQEAECNWCFHLRADEESSSRKLSKQKTTNDNPDIEG